MTDNHNYSTPEKGTTDWHIPLNENFQKIDTDAEIRDVESNRSGYTPKDGAAFRATDTGNVFIGDGSSWNKQNPPADTSSGGPYTAGSVADILSQAADTATDFVYIAPGTYTLDGSGPVEPSAGTTILADKGSVTLQMDTGGYHGILIRDSDRVKVSGVSIQGYRERDPDQLSQKNAIHIQRSSDVVIENCELYKTTRHGISVDTTKSGTTWGRVTMRNNWIHDCDSMGINVFGPDETIRDIHAIGNRIEFLGKNRDGSDRPLTTGATPSGSGIGLESIDRGGIVANNYVRMVAKEGIRAMNSTIVGNQVINFSQYGSQNRAGIWNTLDQQDGITISSNQVWQTQSNGGDYPAGIQLYTSSGTSDPQVATITGNVVIDEVGAVREGIHLFGKRMVATGNRVQGCTRGIMVGSSAGSTESIVINGNYVDGSTDCLSVRYNCSNVMVLGNGFTNASRDGVWVSDTDGCTVGFNVLTGSANGVYDRGSNSNLTTTGNL